MWGFQASCTSWDVRTSTLPGALCSPHPLEDKGVYSLSALWFCLSHQTLRTLPGPCPALPSWPCLLGPRGPHPQTPIVLSPSPGSIWPGTLETMNIPRIPQTPPLPSAPSKGPLGLGSVWMEGPSHMSLPLPSQLYGLRASEVLPAAPGKGPGLGVAARKAWPGWFAQPGPKARLFLRSAGQPRVSHCAAGTSVSPFSQPFHPALFSSCGGVSLWGFARAFPLAPRVSLKNCTHYAKSNLAPPPPSSLP